METPFVFTGNPGLDALIVCSAAVAVALVAHSIVSSILGRAFRSRPTALLFLRHLKAASRWIVVFLALQAAWQLTPPDLRYRGALIHATSLLLIAAATWLVMCLVTAATEVVLVLHAGPELQDVHARRVRTQARVIGRTLKVFAVLFGVSAALMTFPEVRRFGTTLMASAGVAGLIVGLAARPVFGNIFAGLQIALSQPIRIGDTVVVEGQFGTIEEITGTFVVVRLWDQRRLVVPLQRFIEAPFENWSRSSTEILGTFLLWVDYGAPVDAIRQEMMRLVKQDPDWDGRAAGLQVTDFTERTMQLRVLVSTANAGKNFDLRCRLREGLIAYIQREHPDALPQVRAAGRISEPASSAAAG